MRRWRTASGVAAASLLAVVPMLTPAASAVSTGVTNAAKTVTCTVTGLTPSYTKNGNTVYVTAKYRVTCTRTSSAITSITVNTTVGAVEVDADNAGKLTVVDPKAELADTASSTTFKFTATTTSIDFSTKSFACVNTDTATGDNEEIETKVKVGVVSGVWSSIDYSTVLSAPC